MNLFLCWVGVAFSDVITRCLLNNLVLQIHICLKPAVKKSFRKSKVPGPQSFPPERMRRYCILWISKAPGPQAFPPTERNSSDEAVRTGQRSVSGPSNTSILMKQDPQFELNAVIYARYMASSQQTASGFLLKIKCIRLSHPISGSDESCDRAVSWLTVENFCSVLFGISWICRFPVLSITRSSGFGSSGNQLIACEQSKRYY